PANPDVPWNERQRPFDMKSAPVVTQLSLNQENYGRIYRLIQKGVKVELDLDLKVNFQTADLNCYNTVAEIAGTDPELKDEIVMLGAHLDSWHTGTGATDNGAGCGVMMEAVRLLKAAGVKPKRTIRIALWSGEEQGLFGSRAYVKEHFGEGAAWGAPASTEPIPVKADHSKLSGYFNVDNGTGQIRGIYLQQNDLCRNIFRAWLEPFKDWNATTISFANTGGTDHLSFDGVGLPGFQFIQDPMEYGTWTHHSNMDVYERIQEEDMKRNAIIVAAFVYQTAQRAEKLPRKPANVKVANQ
ncbi:MAG: M20/M25/M40 family metallo-hydrolase, partial [Rhizobacter sp.]|nr:M20/M25/M40 family metallo-hydrolase [Chlorobiales bacterium]